VKNNFLPEEHELLEIKKKVNFSFIEKETEDLYSKDTGRPSYPPEVMFKILFLEFYYNLSDVEIAKQLKFNVLFRYFVGLRAEDPLPDDTSLVVFRKRLTEKRFEKIFDKFVKQCREKGLLKERLKLIDATHIIADVAIPNTTNFLRDGRRRILKAIKKERKSKYSDGYLYYFSSEVCKSCNRKKECPLNKNRARVYVSDSHILYIKSDPEQKKKALEKRKRIV